MDSLNILNSYTLALELTNQLQANRIASLQKRLEETTEKSNAKQDELRNQMCQVHRASMKFIASLRTACGEYNEMADLLIEVLGKGIGEETIPTVHGNNQSL